MSKKLIKILAVDIDGCITPGEGESADLEVLGRLKEYNMRSGSEPEVPAVTLCTGRQQPFVDLMSQMIGARKPAVFENGAGLYIPDTYEFLFHPSITPAMLEELGKLKQLIKDEMVAGGTAKLQPGKEVSLSVYPAAGHTVAENAEQLRGLLQKSGIDIFLDISILCVNVIFPGIDKGAGVRWLCERLGLGRDEVGAVGDAPGDVSAFAAAGFSATPANGMHEARAAATFIASQENGRGVLEIVEEVIRRNKAL